MALGGRRGLPRHGTRTAVQHATLALPLPVQPTAVECAALLKALIKHLLFQRAQIPYLYDELLRFVHEQQLAAEKAAASGNIGGKRPRRRRVPKADRRLLKFLSKAEELMAAVDAALATSGVPRRAFLLLGASTNRPREAYEVLLPPAVIGPTIAQVAPQPGPAQQQQAGEGTAPGAPQQPMPSGRPKLSRQERLCLLALRQLVVAGAELPQGTADKVPCKLFVLFEGASSSGGPDDGIPASNAAKSGIQAADLAAPPGFSVKRQFKLSMLKGVHLTLQLGQHPQPEQPPQLLTVLPEPQEQAEAGHSGDNMDTGSSCSCSEDEEVGQSGAAPTEHLSQLPDAASQPPPTPAHGSPLLPEAALSTAGSVWYLCKTALKGLNSSSQDDGGAEGF